MVHCVTQHFNVIPDGDCCMCMVVCRNQSFLMQVFFTQALLEHLICQRQGRLSPEAADADSVHSALGKAAGRLPSPRAVARAGSVRIARWVLLMAVAARSSGLGLRRSHAGHGAAGTCLTVGEQLLGQLWKSFSLLTIQTSVLGGSLADAVVLL